MLKNVRVRFAPSPTGYLHIGNARTALFNWLFARKYRGEFILRVEDTDLERSQPQFETALVEDLKWLGLHWDEGPDCGGKFSPYRQSDRQQLYTDAVEKMLHEGKAYKCYCTPEELEAERKKLLAEGKPPRYLGRCRNLTAEQRLTFEKEGRVPNVRFKVEGVGSIVVEDLIRGEVSTEKSLIGDFVILRSNGIPAYNLAVVVDDAAMEITHVLRGEDHLSNTPRQQLLYEALGHKLPHFAHFPMILGEDRTMLSKRHGAASVAQFRKEGYLPNALVNYLALLGWSPGEGREILTLDEMVEEFSLTHMAKSPAVFDMQKLNWLNGHYIRETDILHLTALCVPYLIEAGYLNAPPESKKLLWLHSVIEAVRPNLVKLSDAPQVAHMFFRADFPLDPEAVEIAREGKAVIMKLAEDLASGPDKYNEQDYQEIMYKIKKATGEKGKKLFMPVRIALSGDTHGPELKHIFTLLDKEQCLARVEHTLKFIV